MEQKKIVQYKTIWVKDKCIDEDVNDAIKTGWQPLGGISHVISNEEPCVMYCQAMVKYEK